MCIPGKSRPMKCRIICMHQPNNQPPNAMRPIVRHSLCVQGKVSVLSFSVLFPFILMYTSNTLTYIQLGETLFEAGKIRRRARENTHQQKNYLILVYHTYHIHVIDQIFFLTTYCCTGNFASLQRKTPPPPLVQKVKEACLLNK